MLYGCTHMATVGVKGLKKQQHSDMGTVYTTEVIFRVVKRLQLQTVKPGAASDARGPCIGRSNPGRPSTGSRQRINSSLYCRRLRFTTVIVGVWPGPGSRRQITDPVTRASERASPAICKKRLDMWP